MQRKVVLTVLIMWLIVVWVLFAHYQWIELTKEGHVGAYLVSLLKVIVVVGVATGLGLRLIGPKKPDPRSALPAFAVGLALLGMVMLVLGSLGAMRSYILWPILAGLGVLSLRQIRTLPRSLSPADVSRYDLVEIACICAMILAAVTLLVSCLAPLTANDALVYHLNLPKIYASEGGLARLPFNVYANMPHYGEMLYTLFYVIAGETGAKISYFLIVLAAAGSVYLLARRFVDRKPALLGASAFLVQPLVIDHRIICNVDNLLAYMYLSAIILTFQLWHRRRRYMLPALLAGFMLGIKYTAILPCITLLAIPLLAMSRRSDWKRLAVGAAIAFVVLVPWLVKNEAQIGNPVYPVFERVFDGDHWDIGQNGQLMRWQRSMGMGRSVRDYLLLPLRLTTEGKPGMNYTRFDGTLSPVLLILIPLALLSRRRQTYALMVMALAGFVFWAATSQQARFLIPTIAIGAVLASLGLAGLMRLVGGRAIGVLMMVILAVEISTLVVPDQYGRPFVSNTFGDRLAAVTGAETTENHLERQIQSYSVFQHINATIPSGEAVFMIWENRGYYLDRPYFADSFFEASTFMRIVSESGNARALSRRIRAMGYRYVLVNDLLGGFFSRGYDPATLATVEDFVTNHLKPIHTSNRITLYTLLQN